MYADPTRLLLDQEDYNQYSPDSPATIENDDSVHQEGLVD